MRGAKVYAETELEVHAVHAKAKQRSAELDQTLTKLSTARDDKRTWENRLADYESDVTMHLRAENPEMPTTAFERLVKETIRSDAEWRRLRDAVTAAISEVEAFEFDKSFLSKEIDIATARMNQLGGYLFYLGVAGQNEISKTSSAS